MPPSGYIQSRELSKASSKKYFATLVDHHPYLPNLSVDANDEISIKSAAFYTVLTSIFADHFESDSHSQIQLLSLPSGLDNEHFLHNSLITSLKCTRITGGITNALFQVSGFRCLGETMATVMTWDAHTPERNFSRIVDYDSVLLRIFGAEGMIDRDIENSMYVALCDAGIAHKYIGRFQNGRVEGWLEGYYPLNSSNLSDEETSLMIAKDLARLHCLFEVPEGELRDHHGQEVGLWNQLRSWMAQTKEFNKFSSHDLNRVKLLDLDRIEQELQCIIHSYTDQSTISEQHQTDGRIVFCHNDLLAANIMRHPLTNKIQLIDFEYGGTNYAAYDIANHFNEHAGGTTTEENGHPDYNRFPKPERQMKFCIEYVKVARDIRKQKSSLLNHSCLTNGNVHDDVVEEATELLNQVNKYVLVNHLHWGLWAVNQAKEEGCDEFDYITYATNRFREFYKRKAAFETEES